MKTICQPSCVNSFMEKHELTHIYLCIRDKTTTFNYNKWVICFICTRPAQELLAFIKIIHKNHLYIKLDFKYFRDNVF